MQKFKKIFLAFVVGMFVLLPALGQAQTQEEKDRCAKLQETFKAELNGGVNDNFVSSLSLPKFCSAGQILTYVINLALTLAGIVAVGSIILGGFWYLTAAGNDEQVEKGKKVLINSIIGLVVIIMASAIVRIVANTLTGKLDGGSSTNTTQAPTGTGGNNSNNTTGGSIELTDYMSSLPEEARAGQSVNISFTYSSNSAASRQQLEEGIITTCGVRDLSGAYLELFLANQSVGKGYFSKTGSSISASVNATVPAKPGNQSYEARICNLSVRAGQVNITQSSTAAPSGSSGQSGYDLCMQQVNDDGYCQANAANYGPVSSGGTANQQSAANRSSFSINDSGENVIVNINASDTDKEIICEGAGQKSIDLYYSGRLAETGPLSLGFFRVNLNGGSAANLSVKICGYVLKKT